MSRCHLRYLVLSLLALYFTPAFSQETERPVKPFSFITDVPGNIVGIAKTPFKKKNLAEVGILASTTGILLLLDQAISDGARKFFKEIGIEQQECFKPIKIGELTILDHHCNVNSFFYQLGSSSPSLLFAGGFYLVGKIGKDSRASRTASEIASSFLSSVVVIQTLKRMAGRQAPTRATIRGGVWHWFPSLKDYNSSPTNYLAYPSGHMANMMSLVTVISENYPEKKWIKPVGYSLITLTALSQQNNQTHWASDIPLGLAIGYVSGKIAHARNENRKASSKLITY